MTILTVVGARPQFIKAAPLSRALRNAGQKEILVHTGQHYDRNMSAIFFEELGIPAPAVNLKVGSGSHGKQTGAMLAGIEAQILKRKPDWVIVFGDTNSTLAGALAASKLNVPVAHVESGLRSFNRKMPEEINRVLTDHISALLFCPSQQAADHLRKEGVEKGVHVVGDVMADAVKNITARSEGNSDLLESLNLKRKKYLLATVHRPENTDNHKNLMKITAAMNDSAETIIFPAHPRTQRALSDAGIELRDHVRIVDPVSYLTMILLLKSARMVLTDSGGLQKEAYWLKTPCITMRNETEWIETVQCGWNVLVGSEADSILEAIGTFIVPRKHPKLYGDGNASRRIIRILTKYKHVRSGRNSK